MRKTLTAGLGLCLLTATGLIVALPAEADTGSYTFTTFDFPGATSGTFIAGLNNSGQMTGYYGKNYRRYGFLETPGQGFASLSMSSVTASIFAERTNQKGQIVGDYFSGQMHGFVCTPGKGLVVLDFPGAKYTIPRGVNNAGQIVGYYLDAAGYHSFLDTPGAGFTTLNFPGSTKDTFATALNDKGQIAGDYRDSQGQYHGFLATPVPEPALSLTLGLGVSVVGFTLLRARRRNKPAAS